MHASLSTLLRRFNEDPVANDAMLVQRLRDQDRWVVATDAQGRVQSVQHSRGRFIALGTEPSDVDALGEPRTVLAAEVLAMVPAGLVEGVVIGPAEDAPVWLDLAGVVRISGVPGLKLADTLEPRSVEELHLYLDLFGWPTGDRPHAVTSTDAGLVARYTRDTGSPGQLDFTLPDPVAEGFGGPGASAVMDPVGWRLAADTLAGAVEVDPADAQRGRHARLLARALRCLDEALRFAVDGQIPAEAFFSESGRRVYALAPGRFDVDRLGAVKSAWQALHARFAG